MSTDLKTQIRDFAQEFASVLPPIDLEDLLDPRVATKHRPTQRRRGWVVALAAMTAVIVLMGGLALLFNVDSDDQPVIDEPTPTTVIKGVGGGWSLVPVEQETLAGATIRSVIRTKDGLVAVGLQDTNVVAPGATPTTAPGARGGLGPGVWLSEDGVEWTRVPPVAFTGQGAGGINDVAEG